MISKTLMKQYIFTILNFAILRKDNFIINDIYYFLFLSDKNIIIIICMLLILL